MLVWSWPPHACHRGGSSQWVRLERGEGLTGPGEPRSRSEDTQGEPILGGSRWDHAWSQALRLCTRLPLSHQTSTSLTKHKFKYKLRVSLWSWVSRRDMPFVTALVTDPWSQSCSLLSFSQFMPLRNVGWVRAVFSSFSESRHDFIWNLTFKQKLTTKTLLFLLLYYGNPPPLTNMSVGLISSEAISL